MPDNRVIKLGVPVFAVFEMDCSTCGSRFEVPAIENVKKESRNDSGQGRNWNAVTTVCPACGHTVDVPSDVREVLLKILEFERIRKR